LEAKTTLRIVKVDERNRQSIVDSLKSDIIRHVFAFYDIQYDLEHTTMHAAFDNQALKRYILTYTALTPPSVVLDAISNAAEKLITYAPENKFVLHTLPNLLPIVKRRYPEAKCYIENWMLVRKSEATFFKSRIVRKLSAVDAVRLAELLSNGNNLLRAEEKRYEEWIRKNPTYGVFIDKRLVSYASSFLQLPQVWMIGGVYTRPELRNKGYATLVTSAVTEEALNKAENAALFVGSNNYPAIKVYEKIGYKKIGERVWVDVGTGKAP
jgi:predicted GNAT family acetyltransferase